MRRLKHGIITPSPALRQMPAVSPLPLQEPRSGIRALHDEARAAWGSNLIWRSESPRQVVDRFIDAVPDKAVIYPTNDAHIAPDAPDFALEHYFLGQLKDLPVFEDFFPMGALSALDSTRCLCDRIRTKKFLLGVREAVKKLEAGKGGDISVCDAGCGAIPIQAIYAALCSERARCTALELNPQSAEIARMMVGQLGLADRIRVIEADAIAYRPEHGIDLLVSETMQSGLTAEPLVQILSNLSKYVSAGGVILPTKVSVMAALIPLDEFAMPKRHVRIHAYEHRHMSADWKTAVEYVPGARLDMIEARLPTLHLKPGCYCAFVTSEVGIGARTLGLYESLITMPQIVIGVDSKPKFFYAGGRMTRVMVRYAPGDLPYATADDRL